MRLNVNMDFGKLPPQAIDLEEAVLGSCMLEPECIFKISHILKPECFYKDAHQKIYSAIQELVKKGQTPDILTVTEKLRSNKNIEEVGGSYYVAQLTQRVGSSYNIEFHSQIIKQKYLAREIIRYSNDLSVAAYDDTDLFELQALAQNRLYDIISNTITKEAIKASIIIGEEIEYIGKLISKEIEFTGIPSGFTKLDRITGGWQNSDLIVIGARPSMGKTSYGLYFAKFPSSIGKPVAVFSLEMSEKQIIQRLISYETKLDSMALRRGRITPYDFHKLDSMLTKYNDYPLYIDDTPGLSILEFSSKAKLYKMKYGIELIIVDYIQLMQGDKKGNRDQEIGSISRGLKLVAKTLNIPIIALAQLSRETEKRKDKRPLLSDLRESGNLEQDPDVICFIHRPDKYGETVIDIGNGEESAIGLINFMIAKNRNGSVADLFHYTDESFNNLREDKEFFPEVKGLPFPKSGEFIDKNIESKKDAPF